MSINRLCYDPVTMPTIPEKKFIAYCIFLVVIVHLVLMSMEWRRSLDPSQSDFLALYAAGRSARFGGERGSEPSSLPGSKNSVPDFKGIPDQLHPPFEKLIFAPLSLLPYQAAYLLWYGCNLVMVFSVPFLLWRYIPNLHRWFAYFVVMSATFFPVFVAVVKGQDSVLVLFLLTLCFLCLKSRRETLGGVVLALGMFKFTLIIPIAAAFVVRRKWRLLAGFVGSFLAMLLATAALLGTGAIPGYLRFVENRGGPLIDAIGNESLMPNLRGFLHPLATGAVSRAWVGAAVVVGSIAIFAIISRRLRAAADEPSELDLLYSIDIVTAVIVSFHLYVHDDCVLLVPILLTLNRLAGSDCRKTSELLMALSAGIFILSPFIVSLRVSTPLYFFASVLLLWGMSMSLQGTASERAEEEEELSLMRH
jgi:hypothetical protein